MVRVAPPCGALCTKYDANCTMKRFTVSLPEDRYAALRERGDSSMPPANLQQMVRFAVDAILDDAETPTAPEASVGSDQPTQRPAIEPVDLLVFSVGDVSYGLPIKVVETVAAGLQVHPVPTTNASHIGVAAFRDNLTEVHDGGVLLQGRSVADTDAMLAIPGGDGRVLMTVTSVSGLSPAAEAKWATPPHASPAWVSALTWTEDRVVTVVDPTAFNL